MDRDAEKGRFSGRWRLTIVSQLTVCQFNVPLDVETLLPEARLVPL